MVIQGEGEVENLGEKSQDELTGLLTIYEVTRAQAGPYQCTVNNGIKPPASVVGHLVVHCEFCTYIITSLCLFNMNSSLLIRKIKQLRILHVPLDNAIRELIV